MDIRTGHDMSDVIEVDAVTGQVIERDFTAEELAQREADAVAEQNVADADAARVAARESAMVKLAKLGLNDSEVEAMMGGV